MYITSCHSSITSPLISSHLRGKSKARTVVNDLISYYYNHIELLIFPLAEKVPPCWGSLHLLCPLPGRSFFRFFLYLLLHLSFNYNLLSVFFSSNISFGYHLLIYCKIYLLILFIFYFPHQFIRSRRKGGFVLFIVVPRFPRTLSGSSCSIIICRFSK